MTTELPAAYQALLRCAVGGIVRAVVELHRPTADGWRSCRGCNPDCDPGECWTVWPCPTTTLVAARARCAAG